jgi:hypothetical protein
MHEYGNVCLYMGDDKIAVYVNVHLFWCCALQGLEQAFGLALALDPATPPMTIESRSELWTCWRTRITILHNLHSFWHAFCFHSAFAQSIYTGERPSHRLRRLAVPAVAPDLDPTTPPRPRVLDT